MAERKGLSKEYIEEFKKSMKSVVKKKPVSKTRLQKIFYIRISGHPSSTEPVEAYTSLEAKKKYLHYFDMKRLNVDHLLNIPEKRVSEIFRNRKIVK